MKDCKKLAEDIRFCSEHIVGITCEGCDNDEEETCCLFPAHGNLLRQAADAIDELQDKAKQSAKRNAELHAELERWVSAAEGLQAEVDRLRGCIDELREKQTYIDHYGDKWMTSAKDVPTSAYEHGYADGRDEAMAKMEAQE